MLSSFDEWIVSGQSVGNVMNPYHSFVSGFARNDAAGRSLPLANSHATCARGPLRIGAGKRLIFQPAPDDENASSAPLALRQMREAGKMECGSFQRRQSPRGQQGTPATAPWEELRGRLPIYGLWRLEHTRRTGPEKISRKTRLANAGTGPGGEIISTTLARHHARHFLPE